MRTDLQAGIYSAAEVPMGDYLADPCVLPSLSSGAAHRIITTTPRHVWWSHPRLGGHARESSSRTDMGSVAHELVLGNSDAIAIVDADDWRTKAAQTMGDEARAHGKYPVLRHKFHDAQQMALAAKAFVADSMYAGVFDSGAGEATAIVQLSEWTWLRARPDWLNHDMRVCLHYKTTEGSAAPDPFVRWVLTSMGYDVSMAFYKLVLDRLSDEFREWSHVILLQEQKAPYCCSLITLSPAAWAIADSKVQRAILRWGMCMATDKWPGYGGQVHEAEPTPWQLAEAEQKLQEMGSE